MGREAGRDDREQTQDHSDGMGSHDNSVSCLKTERESNGHTRITTPKVHTQVDANGLHGKQYHRQHRSNPPYEWVKRGKCTSQV